MSDIRNGNKYIFNSVDTELQKYNGKKVSVIRSLTKEEYDVEDVDYMYKVKFPDGYEQDVFEDELS